MKNELIDSYIPPLRWGRELCDMTIPQADEIKLRCEAHKSLLKACRLAAAAFKQRAGSLKNIEHQAWNLCEDAIAMAEKGIAK